MFTLHCTKKLLDRLKGEVVAPLPATTLLGNWYATAMFWRPQVALLVNERTLLPVLMPLAPVHTLTQRFPTYLARVLQAQGVRANFIAEEVAAMSECVVAKTANRSVLGIMKEFVFEAEVYRDHLEDNDLLSLAIRLSGTPCRPIGHNSPDRLLREMVGAGSVE
jgi:hypothetical protein